MLVFEAGYLYSGRYDAFKAYCSDKPSPNKDEDPEKTKEDNLN